MNRYDDIIGYINDVIREERMSISNYYLKDKQDVCEICIVVDKLNKRKIDLTKAIRKKLFYKINFPLDIFVYEKEEFNEKSSVVGSVEHSFKERGTIIHGQANATC